MKNYKFELVTFILDFLNEMSYIKQRLDFEVSCDYIDLDINLCIDLAAHKRFYHRHFNLFKCISRCRFFGDVTCQKLLTCQCLYDYLFNVETDLPF